MPTNGIWLVGSHPFGGLHARFRSTSWTGNQFGEATRPGLLVEGWFRQIFALPLWGEREELRTLSSSPTSRGVGVSAPISSEEEGPSAPNSSESERSRLSTSPKGEVGGLLYSRIACKLLLENWTLRT
jgi:hypothetical protein